MIQVGSQGEFRPEPPHPPGAGPVLQPVDRPDELRPDLGRDERHPLELGLHLLLPARVAVLQEPLVVQDLHKDPPTAPADHLPVIELVHRDRAVAFHHQRRHIIPGLADRLSAVVVKDLPAGELRTVDLLGERLHPRIVLVADTRPLDRVLCRDLAVALDGYERDRLDARVLPPLLLQVAERDVVEGCVGGNAHHDPGPPMSGSTKVAGRTGTSPESGWETVWSTSTVPGISSPTVTSWSCRASFAAASRLKTHSSPSTVART